jgi:predicted MFS family arabinose efflux permease
MAGMPIAPRLPSPRAALTTLTGINLFNFLDRYVLGAVLPAVAAALSLSDTQAGSLPTVFILTFALVSPIAGALGDRQPRFRLAAIGVLVWSLATCASGLAATFAALALARALTGVGEASYTVVTPSLLSDFYPPERRSGALARFYAAIPIGSAAGFLIGGEVNAHWGWRAAFFVAGAPGALLALVLLAFRDPPRGVYDPKPDAPLSAAAALRALGARKSYWFNTAAQTLYTFTMGGLAIWMPTYFVRVHHLPLRVADLGFGGVLVVSGFVGTLAGGRAGDRLAARRSDGHFLISAISLIGSLPFTLLALLHPSPAIFWPAMFASLTLLFVISGPLNAAMVNVLPAELRARGFSVYTLLMHLLGDAPSPFIVGVVSSRMGIQTPTLALGLLPVLAGLVLLAGRGALRRDIAATGAAA